MKPICVPCERFMRPKRTGYYFLEGMPERTNVARGKNATGWKPYKLWAGDLWECPDCGTQIVSGVGQAPIAEHFYQGFAADVARTRADQLLVKDC